MNQLKPISDSALVCMLGAINAAAKQVIDLLDNNLTDLPPDAAVDLRKVSLASLEVIDALPETDAVNPEMVTEMRALFGRFLDAVS